jgi:hypothetical protein
MGWNRRRPLGTTIEESELGFAVATQAELDAHKTADDHTDYYLADGTRALNGPLNHDGATAGFFGTTPVAQAAAYTQTYATADRTLAAYTPDDESGAYTGIDNLQTGTVYATVADLNALRTAYENLRALVEDAAALENAVVDDLQAYGLVQ